MDTKITAKPGDKVEISTKEKKYVGKIMPQDKDSIVLKLDSGYNIGIDKKNIVSINVVEHKTQHGESELKKEEKALISQDKALPKISILHTGGTIASKVDYETGGVIARFSPQELLSMFPELKNIANINSKLMRNMFSDDMRFAHYNVMAKEIENEVKDGAKGIIITHGTDTLHYTSAALSFILENLGIPVILVGAQRSSDRPSSDAAYNLISAAYFIANEHAKWCGVGVCMHENESDDNCVILPGLKVRKMHSSRRDAFKAINSKPIAKINFKHKKIELFEKKEEMKEKANGSNEKLILKPINDKLKIGILKSHPQMYAEEVLAYKDFDGLVLEGTGLGHFPVSEIDEFTKEHPKILGAIEDVAKKIPVAISTQTIYGRTNIKVYANGRKLIDAGVIGNLSDMTPETTFVKLAWLLSNYKKDEIRVLMEKNLRGEISERTKNNFDVF